ncbi:MAG: ubiquinone biosynthesis protein UbiH, partial [Burkholderiales bacterium]|nr:ubiquinone biosynthesis protein UbiH [Burkholderiales bacterium]
LGDAKLLRRYERERAADTLLMGTLTDSLWLGFSQAPEWARQLASQGLSAVDQLSPLKRWLSRQAMGRSPQPGSPA